MTTSHRGSDRDPTAELLSENLHARAALVQTDPEALQVIRRRTALRRRRRRAAYAGLAGATAAATIVAGVVGMDLLDRPRPSEVADSPRDASPAASTRVLAVTYPGKVTGQGDARLFTEKRAVVVDGTDEADRAVARVREYLTSKPADPDLFNGWPTGLDVSAVEFARDSTRIELTGTSIQGPVSDIAVQALLRNAGVPPGTRAVIQLDGELLPQTFGVDQPVLAAPDEQVRAWVSIDNLREGETVPAPVTVRVSGNVVEGNVNWELHDESGKRVGDGYVTTAMGSWKQASIRLGDLQPGSYTIRCFEVDLETGEPINVDDKTFTVL